MNSQGIGGLFDSCDLGVICGWVSVIVAHEISTCWVTVGNPAKLPYLLGYKYFTPSGGVF